MIEPIEIKGIVRNTTKQNSENGTMEEIINLRRRDGNLEPMPPEQVIWGNFAQYSDQFSQLFIHNGKDYKHLLGIMVKDNATTLPSPYNVIYIGDITDGNTLGDDGLPIPILNINFVETGIKVERADAVVHQIGNLVTIHSNEQIQHILWEEEKYVDVTINANSDQDDDELLPDGEIEIMSTASRNEDGTFKIYAVGGKITDDSEDNDWTTLKEDTTIMSSVGASSIIQAESFAKSKGLLVGYVVAVPVLELYDGSYVYAGKPQLVPKSFVKCYSAVNITGNALKGVLPEDKNTNSGGSFYYEFNNNDFNTISVGGNPICVMGCINKTSATSWLHNKPYFNADATWGIISGNDLIFKINRNAQSQYKNIIKNICIFISNNIYDYDPNKSNVNVVDMSVANMLTNGDGKVASYSTLSDDEIINAIHNVGSLYKVHSEPYISAKRNEWIRVKLEDKLNILEQQEILNVDASSMRHILSANNSYMYNGRLHVSDISEKLFHGFPMMYQQQKKMYYNIPNYWQGNTWNWEFNISRENPHKFYMIYDIATDNGWSRVGVTTQLHQMMLNPLVFYPDSRAMYVHIGEVYHVNGVAHAKEKVYVMHPFKALEGSIVCMGLQPTYVQPVEGFTTLECEVVSFQDIVNNQVTWNGTEVKTINRELSAEEIASTFDLVDGFKIKEQDVILYRPNVLKVSAVETPLFFPAISTYQIGNGEIRGVCANTTALSVGQWGDAPLFVFASDGIYGLFVDATGNLVYGSSRPISREVCNNSKSITPIDDAIVFSSERGLMVIQGSEVQEISAPIEGKVLKFATADTHPERLDSAKRLLGFEDKDILAWVDMSTMPTGEEAKEYLRNSIIGYNYDNKEIWVANPTKDYIYIYSGGMWSKAKRKITSFINDYPKTYALMDDHKAIDISRSTKGLTDAFFLTRPIVIEGENAKHFQKVWLYGDFNVADNTDKVNEYLATLTEETTERKNKLKQLLKHKTSLFVYGSADGARYSMLGCGGIEGVTRNIISKVHRMSLRYIRILFVGKVEHDTRIESLMVEYKDAYGQSSTMRPR